MSNEKLKRKKILELLGGPLGMCKLQIGRSFDFYLLVVLDFNCVHVLMINGSY